MPEESTSLAKREITRESQKELEDMDEKSAAEKEKDLKTRLRNIKAEANAIMVLPADVEAAAPPEDVEDFKISATKVKNDLAVLERTSALALGEIREQAVEPEKATEEKEPSAKDNKAEEKEKPKADLEAEAREFGAKNFYERLGVSPDADLVKDIKPAFKKLAFKYHPDRGGNDQVMRLLSEAFSVLQDTELRKQYNRNMGFDSARKQKPLNKEDRQKAEAMESQRNQKVDELSAKMNELQKAPRDERDWVGIYELRAQILKSGASPQKILQSGAVTRANDLLERAIRKNDPDLIKDALDTESEHIEIKISKLRKDAKPADLKPEPIVPGKPTPESQGGKKTEKKEEASDGFHDSAEAAEEAHKKTAGSKQETPEQPQVDNSQVSKESQPAKPARKSKREKGASSFDSQVEKLKALVSEMPKETDTQKWLEIYYLRRDILKSGRPGKKILETPAVSREGYQLKEMIRSGKKVDDETIDAAIEAELLRVEVKIEQWEQELGQPKKNADEQTRDEVTPKPAGEEESELEVPADEAEPAQARGTRRGNGRARPRAPVAGGSPEEQMRRSMQRAKDAEVLSNLNEKINATKTELLASGVNFKKFDNAGNAQEQLQIIQDKIDSLKDMSKNPLRRSVYNYLKGKDKTSLLYKIPDFNQIPGIRRIPGLNRISGPKPDRIDLDGRLKLLEQMRSLLERKTRRPAPERAPSSRQNESAPSPAEEVEENEPVEESNAENMNEQLRQAESQENDMAERQTAPRRRKAGRGFALISGLILAGAAAFGGGANAEKKAGMAGKVEAAPVASASVAPETSKGTVAPETSGAAVAAETSQSPEVSRESKAAQGLLAKLNKASESVERVDSRILTKLDKGFADSEFMLSKLNEGEKSTFYKNWAKVRLEIVKKTLKKQQDGVTVGKQMNDFVLQKLRNMIVGEGGQRSIRDLLSSAQSGGSNETKQETGKLNSEASDLLGQVDGLLAKF